jgi:hypothetical protein
MREKSITLDNLDNIIPISCTISNGEITPAFVAEKSDFKVPTDLYGLAYSSAAGLYMAVNASGIYCTIDGGKFTSISASSGTKPFFVEDVYSQKPRLVTVFGSTMYIHDKSSFVGIKLDNELLCGVMHRGRLFAADLNERLKIYWTGEGGIRDWSKGLYKGGHMYLNPERGKILNLVEFDEKIVIVREYGLSLFSANGNPENFCVNLSDTDTDKIYENTACVLGGKLYFYTTSGLYAFDGNDIEKVEHNLSHDVLDPTYALTIGDMYVLSCKSKTLEKQVVLVYNATKGFAYYVDIKADVMYLANGLCIVSDNVIYTLKEGENWSISCGRFDFGTGKNCTLVEAYVGGNATFTIGNGRYLRTFSSFSGTVRPKFRGKKFSLKISGQQKVQKVQLTGDITYGI